jgi:hypothetical protein
MQVLTCYVASPCCDLWLLFVTVAYAVIRAYQRVVVKSIMLLQKYWNITAGGTKYGVKHDKFSY